MVTSDVRCRIIRQGRGVGMGFVGSGLVSSALTPYVGVKGCHVYGTPVKLAVMEGTMPVLMLFLMWPLIEIGLFVTLGGAIGLWMTMLIVLGTAALGITLLRSQGLRTAEVLRREMGALRDPVQMAGDGALQVLAAIFLILPGFLTDTLGALLLIPPLRSALIAALSRRFVVRRGGMDDSDDWSTGAMRQDRGTIIDGDFIELDSDTPNRRPPSAWTRH